MSSPPPTSSAPARPSIPEALRLVPGVQVARINTSGWAISVRGFNSALANKLLVLIDGRESLRSAVLRRVLGRAGHRARRHRAHRSRARPGREPLGRQRRQRRHQHHHASARPTRRARSSARSPATSSARASRRATAATVGRERALARLRRALRPRDRRNACAAATTTARGRRGAAASALDCDASARDALTLQGDIYHSETGQLRVVLATDGALCDAGARRHHRRRRQCAGALDARA